MNLSGIQVMNFCLIIDWFVIQMVFEKRMKLSAIQIII